MASTPTIPLIGLEQSTGQGLLVKPTNGRKNSTKSRSGCKRCKERRLKCDETKPGCLQCKKRKMDCPGYAIILQWSARHEKLTKKTHPTKCGFGPSEKNNQNITTSTERGDLCQGARFVGHGLDEPDLADPQRDSLPLLYVDDESDTSNLPFSPSKRPKQNNELPEMSIPLSPSWFENTPWVGIPHPNFDEESSKSATSPQLPPDNLMAIQQRLASVPRFLIHMPTILVDHYFDSVCPIFSTFDNSMNPFRSVVKRLWDGWAPLYYTIQSMAAAYLSNDFPHLRQVGLQLQCEAHSCLNQTPTSQANTDGEMDDKSLFIIILLGITTSWHRSDDLGQAYLQTATKLFQRRRLRETCYLTNSMRVRQEAFYEQCIVYWEMLSAMMSDVPLELTNAVQDTAVLDLPLDLAQDHGSRVSKFPHPWTGVSPKIISLFAQTGRLVRQTRQTQSLLSSKSTSLDSLFVECDERMALKLREQCERAELIEESILDFTPLSAKDLVDTGDSRTPLDHLIQIHECYRYASLVLIYRNFPKLLLKRLPGNRGSEDSEIWDESYLGTLQIPMPDRSGDRTWVTSLALLVLKSLKGLPPSSGTRFLQPMLILSTACELRFTINGPTGTGFSTYDCPVTRQVDSNQIEIAQARRFVLLRLHELQTTLPMSPIVRMKMLIEETWRRIDTGVDAFWWDVMTENGWETIAG